MASSLRLRTRRYRNIRRHPDERIRMLTTKNITAKAMATTAAIPAATPPTMAPVLVPELGDGVLEALAAAGEAWLVVIRVVTVLKSTATLVSDVTTFECVVGTYTHCQV